MKKLALKVILLAAFLTVLMPHSNGQSATAKPQVKPKTKTCSHCGKASCDKNCSSNSITNTKVTNIQKKTLPSCSLNEKEFTERGDTLSKTIFSKAKSINVLKDGYDIVFKEPKEFSLELIEMVNFERSCCSEFTWALIFEPNNKATHLQVYGSKKIKTEMRNAFKSFGIDQLIK
jgi:hypothetical protein